MSEPTTEQAVDVEVVDTPPWPGPLVTIPAATQVPQDSAVEALNLASEMLADVLAYRDHVVPALAVDLVSVEHVEQVAEARRKVGVVAALIGARDMPGAELVAQQAARHAERLAGRVVAYAPKGMTAAGVLGNAADRCLAMMAGTDEEFERALALCVDAGSASADAVISALAAGGLDVAEQQQRDTIVRLAAQGKTAAAIAGIVAIPRDRVVEIAKAADVTLIAEAAERAPAAEFVPALLDLLRSASTPPAALLDFDEVPPSQAADWSRELWALLVPMVGVRVAADKRSKER